MQNVDKRYHPLSREQWKIVLLSSLGGMLEYYDFVIFAIFATSIGNAFFPGKSAINSAMSVFAVFALGYLVRPIGGIIFSHFGDKYGRKRSFLSTIIIMGAATLLIALLPSEEQLGITASILFILLRLIQGIAVGGEIPGAITFAAEHAQRSAGLACGIVFLFINLGTFLAVVIHALLNIAFKHEPLFFNNAWRIAFILGGIFAVISFFLRQSLVESPEYLQFKSHVVKIPFFALLKTQLRHILSGICLVATQATLISVLFIFMTQYMQLLNSYSPEQVSFVNLSTLAALSLGCAFCGYLADHFGYQRFLIIGSVLLIPSSYFYYYALLHHSHILSAAIAMVIPSCFITGCFTVLLVKLFPVPVRYSGVAFCYNIGFALFGGLTPFFATYLIKQSHDLITPAYIVMAAAILGIIGALLKSPTEYFAQTAHNNYRTDT